jgi:hypothetical protein
MKYYFAIYEMMCFSTLWNFVVSYSASVALFMFVSALSQSRWSSLNILGISESQQLSEPIHLCVQYV